MSMFAPAMLHRMHKYIRMHTEATGGFGSCSETSQFWFQQDVKPPVYGHVYFVVNILTSL